MEPVLCYHARSFRACIKIRRRPTVHMLTFELLRAPIRLLGCLFFRFRSCRASCSRTLPLFCTSCGASDGARPACPLTTDKPSTTQGRLLGDDTDGERARQRAHEPGVHIEELVRSKVRAVFPAVQVLRLREAPAGKQSCGPGSIAPRVRPRPALTFRSKPCFRTDVTVG